MLWYLLSAGLLVGSAAAASNISTPTSSPDDIAPLQTLSSGTLPCDALEAAGLRDRMLFPIDAGYEDQIQTWFALNARRHPWCLVLPQSTSEVSLALKTLVEAGHGAGDWHIAIRSGGHSSIGSNNIDNGVTIDLSMMNSSHYDNCTNTARLGPGGRWEHVYASLQDQGVTVAGGRDGGVGVGGFLLGGGISFFSGRQGFGCDSVINYEVVLANGTIVNANKTANSDLWRALKGGSSNFGIVTRFDMEALPTRTLFYDLRLLALNSSEVIGGVLVDFANANNSLADNAIFAYLTHNTTISEVTIWGEVYVNTVGDANANISYRNIEKLPPLFNRTVFTNMAEAARDSQVPAGMRGVSSTRTFKSDPAIFRYCVQLHEEYVKFMEDAIGAEHFKTMVVFQPIPLYLMQIGQQRGGNMFGLEDMEGGALMWTGGVSVDLDDGALALAQARLNIMSQQIAAFADSVGGNVDWIYLNYADASQDPLGSYGAEQVQDLRNVAAKYDPAGALQTRIPGGFKISRVV